MLKALLRLIFNLFGRFRSPLCPWRVAEEMNLAPGTWCFQKSAGSSRFKMRTPGAGYPTLKIVALSVVRRRSEN
jgi:hypothetical protein